MSSWPKSVLMVDPEHFDVQYVINPHMADGNGQPNKVDRALAKQQWQQLHDTFSKLGLDVHVLPGGTGLPDMVFCANQTFPFEKGGQTHLVLSRMHSPYRQPEVPLFKAWAEKKGYRVHELSGGHFEGMGDALWDYERRRIFGGYGFRTGPEIYQHLLKLTDAPVTTFELRDPRFYHLDTCLALLGSESAAYVAEAFTSEGLATLKSNFRHLIQIPLSEAIDQFAGNLCCPNGKDVIMQSGAQVTKAQLEKAGFRVHEVETSEFMKSGGSVFCMKQLLP